MQAINKEKFGKLFYHLGPSRDDSIFFKVKKNKTKLENSDFILCTGLFDEHQSDLNFYKDLLKKNLTKKLICTNPDLTVHRGEYEEYCAGTIAQIFESLGGEVVYFGKPYTEIYKMCFNKNFPSATSKKSTLMWQFFSFLPLLKALTITIVSFLE